MSDTSISSSIQLSSTVDLTFRTYSFMFSRYSEAASAFAGLCESKRGERKQSCAIKKLEMNQRGRSPIRIGIVQ